MQFKLIATDMDGTLLNSEKKLTERTVTALKKAREAGIIVCLSSGRPPRGLAPTCERVGGDLPLITFNGAEAVMSRSGTVLFENPIDYELACEAYELGREHGVEVTCWESDFLHLGAENDTLLDYRSMSGAPYDVVEDFSVLKGRSLRKVLWVCPNGEVGESLRSKMAQHFNGRLNVATSSPTLIEFVGANVSKGVALHEVCRHLGIDVAETIAFGDGLNDIEMLKEAGKAVVMSNGHPEVKALADDIALSNDEDGVAVYIESLLK